MLEILLWIAVALMLFGLFTGVFIIEEGFIFFILRILVEAYTGVVG